MNPSPHLFIESVVNSCDGIHIVNPTAYNTPGIIQDDGDLKSSPIGCLQCAVLCQYVCDLFVSHCVNPGDRYLSNVAFYILLVNGVKIFLDRIIK